MTDTAVEPLHCEDAAADRVAHSSDRERDSDLPRATQPALPRTARDTDHDGFDDYEDACPHYPEDFDTFDDLDGCPDCDNDGDGILDADVFVIDQRGIGLWVNRDRLNRDCRDEPEDVDGDRDDDGCPDGDPSAQPQ